MCANSTCLVYLHFAQGKLTKSLFQLLANNLICEFIQEGCFPLIESFCLYSPIVLLMYLLSLYKVWWCSHRVCLCVKTVFVHSIQVLINLRLGFNALLKDTAQDLLQKWFTLLFKPVSVLVISVLQLEHSVVLFKSFVLLVTEQAAEQKLTKEFLFL